MRINRNKYYILLFLSVCIKTLLCDDPPVQNHCFYNTCYMWTFFVIAQTFLDQINADLQNPVSFFTVSLVNHMVHWLRNESLGIHWIQKSWSTRASLAERSWSLRRGFRGVSLCPLPLWDCARVHALCAHVILHYITVALLLNAVGQHLQHQTQPTVHSLQMRPDEDGWQSVRLETFLHQRAQFKLFFCHKLKP